MEDYALYIIKAQKLINRINEEANAKNFDAAVDYAFGLEQLAGMLKESLKETV
jgi:hypothetical protein